MDPNTDTLTLFSDDGSRVSSLILGPTGLVFVDVHGKRYQVAMIPEDLGEILHQHLDTGFWMKERDNTLCDSTKEC